MGKDVVRYLGNWDNFDHIGRTSFRKRYDAMREGFYSMGALWKDKEVTLFFKRVVFHASVYQVGMWGLEAEPTSMTDELLLEKHMMRWARRALGQECRPHRMERAGL